MFIDGDLLRRLLHQLVKLCLQVGVAFLEGAQVLLHSLSLFLPFAHLTVQLGNYYKTIIGKFRGMPWGGGGGWEFLDKSRSLG